MADNTTGWTREKKVTPINNSGINLMSENVTSTGSGKYLLEWLDENGDTLISMKLEITGNADETIAQNFQLMKDRHPELFVKPMSEEEIAEMEAQMRAEYEAINNSIDSEGDAQ